MSLLSRTDQGPVSRWFWTVDRWLLGLVMLLIALGLILNLAGSQPIGARKFGDPYHFFERQILFALLGTGVIFGFSLLTRQLVKRVAAILFPLFFMLLMLTLMIGAERNGAQRWLDIPGFSLQPSEFLKPMFIVVTAWILSARIASRPAPAVFCQIDETESKSFSRM